jgi:predicted aminopeptidase
MRTKKRIRRWFVLLALALLLGTLCGCRTLTFYAQAAKGEYELLAHERPTKKLLSDPRTPANLKKQLETLSNLLAFAQSDLKLPADGNYRKYVELRRRYVVWNVEAAPEFSLQPKSWWYPLVGRLEYRGYFSERGANQYGAWLERKGCDVFVGGVEAYSTLGWFKDPALSTFIFNPAPDLAELIFHELGHQEVFASGDEKFNEAFATTVGEAGARRWLRAQGNPAAGAGYEAELGRTRQFAHLIARTRTRLEALYGDELTAEGRVKTAKRKPPMPAAQIREEKRNIFARLQAEYAELKASWGGNTEYDTWFARPLNNAQLNSVAAYYDFVPGFERLLEQYHGDLPAFYKAAARLAKLPKPERHRTLLALGQSAAKAAGD